MSALRYVELTGENWPDLERLFGPRGADAGCWCMFFRLSAKDFRANQGEPNRQALRSLAHHRAPLGLLGMDGDEPVGWAGVAPRPDYPRLARSPVAKPVDAAEDLAGIWSVTCFYIARAARRRGLARGLLTEAVRYAGECGARTVEGYPVDTEGARTESCGLYHGTLRVFTDVGFRVVERRGVRRALVRMDLPS